MVHSPGNGTISASVTKAGVDFGYNFDTIVNSNDSGQGSLRQFIDNANALGNASLAQSALPAGTETSLFMIPSSADPLGRPQDPNFDAGRGVAMITPTMMLPQIADSATTIDGITQRNNIGDTNGGLLGTGGTVGTGADGIVGTGDEPTLSQVEAPEIELIGVNTIDVGLDVQADNTTVRGIAIYGFGDLNISSDHAIYASTTAPI